MLIGVVILNYLSYKVTMDTVESFFNQKHEGIDIRYVIVDNCSPNESYDVLKRKYQNNTFVSVIKAEKNLGFACGNNRGYRELLKTCSPDFVIFSNDDIILPQQGIFQWIISCYERYRFAVLGPDVYSINGKFHQSPMKRKPQSIKHLKSEVKSLRLCLLRGRIKKFLKYKSHYSVQTWENEFYQSYNDKQTLHGSFQIFSPLYFKEFELPYDSRTFLYYEEDIVRLRCDKKGLCCVYDPSYKVNHLQAVSTNMISNNYYDKEINRVKNCLKSLKVYMQVIKELNE